MNPNASSLLLFILVAISFEFSDLRAINIAIYSERTLNETFDSKEDLDLNNRNDGFRRKRAIVKRQIREHIMRCCHSESCPTGPSFNRFLRRRLPGGMQHTAVARFVSDGLSISCMGCPDGWQNDLMLGDGVGNIPVVCPGCEPGWRDLLPSEFKTTEFSELSTTKSKKARTNMWDNAVDTTDEYGNKVEVVTEVINEYEDQTTSEETSTSEESTTEESTTSEEVTTEAESTTKSVPSPPNSRPKNTPKIPTTLNKLPPATTTKNPATLKVSSSPPVTTTKTPTTLKTTLSTTTMKIATTVKALATTSSSKPGLALPPGFTMPAGMQLPPGMKLPDNLGGLASMMGTTVKGSKPGLALPPGFTMPAGMQLPPGMNLPDNLGGLAAMLG
ncbi:mucin-2-like [Neocloeon triangulifer]|uniref:mucin-2-like n=1 Tax=Neocloeon triangulifer TaxID=2078957 RepID=UPI00286EDD3F|nr:mucin-2-like [Neocloeon triangulifer]